MLSIRRRNPSLVESAPPQVPAGAVAALIECHGRIREFIALARRLGEADEASPAEVATAAGQVVRYFTQALPLHARDEEESVAPRLLGLDPFVDAELTVMTREHRDHEPALTALVSACALLELEPARHAGLAGTVSRAAGELERHFAVHLAREEAVIFPAIERLLDPAADAAIVEELRARRRSG